MVNSRENLGPAYLTHLGWSFNVPHFLPPFDSEEGQMQKKNYRCSDGNIEKQAPWFRLGSNLVPPVPFQFLQKSSGIGGTSLESE